MKLLYVLQLSMNDGKQFFPAYDGQLAILQAFIKYFSTLNCNTEFNVLMPGQQFCSDVAYNDFVTAIHKTVAKTTNINVKYIHDPFMDISPIINRYNFSARHYQKLFLDAQYDLIINNIPEIARNVVACYPKDYKTKLISCHWFPDYFFQDDMTGCWDNGAKFSYSFRQLDGILSSDLNIFICESTLKGWQESIEKTFSALGKTQIAAYSNLMSLCVTDIEEYEEISKQFKQDKFTEFTALFPSRVTESMYTNWKVAFDMFLSDPRGRIIFCNPSGDKGLRCIDQFCPNEKYDIITIQLNSGACFRCRSYNAGKLLVVLSPLEKKAYYETCVMAHSIINFYVAERYGGIASREAVALGQLLPFVPVIYEFNEWFVTIGATDGHVRDLSDMLVCDPSMDLSDIEKLVWKYNKFVSNVVLETKQKILNNFKAHEHYLKDIQKFKTAITKLLGENKCLTKC
jgi:hypothetical protein